MVKYQKIEEPETEHRQEGSLLVIGADGSMGDEAMRDRFARQQRFVERMDYRECIPCPKCCNCITFKKYKGTGEIVTTGFYCNSGEVSVGEYHTCNAARRSKTGRIRVVLDTTDAPTWAKYGKMGGSVDEVRGGDFETENSKKYGSVKGIQEIGGGELARRLPPTKPTEYDDYLGGAEKTAEKYGKGGAEGAGDIPRDLVN